MITFIQSFIKWSIRELKHVVWPTKEETSKYFVSIVLVIIGFSLYLFISNTIFTNLIIFLKDNIRL